MATAEHVLFVEPIQVFTKNKTNKQKSHLKLCKKFTFDKQEWVRVFTEIIAIRITFEYVCKRVYWTFEYLLNGQTF